MSPFLPPDRSGTMTTAAGKRLQVTKPGRRSGSPTSTTLHTRGSVGREAGSTMPHMPRIVTRHRHEAKKPDEHRRFPVLQGVVPVNRARISVEVMAGTTLAALGIPEVMGYANIAQVPVVLGLYTILIPIAIFAVVGSSRHLVVGADSATAAIFAAGVCRALPGGVLGRMWTSWVSARRTSAGATSRLGHLWCGATEGTCREATSNPRAGPPPDLSVYRFGADLFYANANGFSEDVLAVVPRKGVEWICIDAGSISDVDYSGSKTLAELHTPLHERHLRLVLADVSKEVREQLDIYGLSAEMGADAVFGSVWRGHRSAPCRELRRRPTLAPVTARRSHPDACTCQLNMEVPSSARCGSYPGLASADPRLPETGKVTVATDALCEGSRMGTTGEAPAAVMDREARPYEALTARERRRLVVGATLRTLATVAVSVTLYYVLPFDQDVDPVMVAEIILGCAVLAVVIVLQLRTVSRSPYPGIRAVEALAFTLPVYVLLFATTYFVMEHTAGSSFTEPLHAHGCPVLLGDDLRHGRIRRHRSQE